MKILFVAMPYAGQVLPTLNVVASLVSQGHIVDYVLTSAWHEQVEGAGALLVPYTPKKSLRAMLREACKIAKEIGRQYDVIVYDHSFFLGRHLAEELGKPCVRLFSSVASGAGSAYELAQEKATVVNLPKQIARKVWTRQVVRGTTSGIKDWAKEVALCAPRCSIAFVPEWFWPEPETFSPQNFHFVGPSIAPQSDAPLPSSPAKPTLPLVYIFLGTGSKKSRGFYRRCLVAFKKQEVNVLLSVGEEVDIQALGDAPPNCHVFHHVPQFAVLKKCSLFITNGSTNAVGEAMTQGVPMVVLPAASDECTNAKRVVELGLGVQLGIRGLSAETLRKTVCALLEDESVRVRALGAKQKLCGANGARAAAELIVQQGR